MTIKDMEAIQRALGNIEGAACRAPHEVKILIITALEIIDGILDKQEVKTDA